VLLGQLPVLIGIGSRAVALVEVGDDVIGVLVDHGTVLENQRRNLIASGLATQLRPVSAMSGHRPSDERDAEFSEPLAHATRVRAPLCLLELVHTK
jgi:hypothetical protein